MHILGRRTTIFWSLRLICWQDICFILFLSDWQRGPAWSNDSKQIIADTWQVEEASSEWPGVRCTVAGFGEHELIHLCQCKSPHTQTRRKGEYHLKSLPCCSSAMLWNDCPVAVWQWKVKLYIPNPAGSFQAMLRWWRWQVNVKVWDPKAFCFWLLLHLGSPQIMVPFTLSRHIWHIPSLYFRILENSETKFGCW